VLAHRQRRVGDVPGQVDDLRTGEDPQQRLGDLAGGASTLHPAALAQQVRQQIQQHLVVAERGLLRIVQYSSPVPSAMMTRSVSAGP
jgi:hypothetical protein